MKLVVRHPNGVEHVFEGSKEELSQAEELIPGFLDGFRMKLTDEEAAAAPAADTPENPEPPEPIDESEDRLQPEALEPARLHAQFSEVNATTDIERVTVLAQAAIDAGMEGLDYETVADLYRKLGLRMPGKWRSTFSNAQNRGYIYSVGRGKWKPTPAGYNLARLGEKSNRRRAGRKPQRISPAASEAEP